MTSIIEILQFSSVISSQKYQKLKELESKIKKCSLTIVEVIDVSGTFHLRCVLGPT